MITSFSGGYLTDRVSAASVKAGAAGASGEAAPAVGVTAKLVGCIR
jgi:hypothetical protein